MKEYQNYLEKNKARFLAELKEFLAIPSISADPKYKIHLEQAANFIKQELSKLALTMVETILTEGQLVVVAEFIQDPKLPTVLLYSHFDVQPPDPLEQWESPPFEAEIRKEAIYARGAADNKTPLFCHLKAVETLIKTKGLPVNIKFVFDGAEEIGSEGLIALIRKQPEKFKADLVLISDTSMILDDLPSLAISLRGLISLELIVKGPNRDLHSGQNGGIVQNPINALAEMITKIQDSNGKIQIPGFYDDVICLTEKEVCEFNQIPFDLKSYKNKRGLTDLTSESKVELLERLWGLPTFDCNGICGGYLGEGQKTIIPGSASAKLSFRIVPHQDPEKIKTLIKEYLYQIKPKGVTIEILEHSGCSAVKVAKDSCEVQLAVDVLTEVHGKKPFFQGVGESIPIVLEFSKNLGIPCLLLGFGRWSDHIHSPNENFKLADFYRGILSLCLFLERYQKNGRTI
ncbi:MAG: dipeptidase [Candidatus Margulisiibacteriota bacterium]|jgi:acetylornithine deacetylase/succinyl-diaminopimelate desuccinylase-like protein